MDALSPSRPNPISRSADGFPHTRHINLTERFRKPVSVLAVTLFLGAIYANRPTEAGTLRTVETVTSFSLATVAVFGRLWCAIYISGRKNAELCMLGPYSLCRNPLYAFSSLGLAGIVLATHRPSYALSAFVIFWCYHLLVIRNEESRLTSLFGSVYTEYCTRVPRAWPRLSAYADSQTLTVNLRPLARALSDVGWFLATWLSAHLIFSEL